MYLFIQKIIKIVIHLALSEFHNFEKKINYTHFIDNVVFKR